MNEEEINNIILEQKNYFASGKTLNVKFRKCLLQDLKKEILKQKDNIFEALHMDLGKSASESYMCEVGLVLNEISFITKRIKNYTKKQRFHTPLAQFHSKSFQIAVPYGNVLIMSPWNYPFLLALDPLVEAIASGNTVLLKLSEYSIYTNKVIFSIINNVFDKGHASVIFGGYLENQIVLNSNFDYIFFTGSKTVGKIVYEAASKNMVPVTLELGGKSPCIVDDTANLKLAAKRIVFGKYLNCGQTCVAPDYILCDKKIKDTLISYLIKEINLQFNDSLNNTNYGSIINSKHFNRLISLLDNNKIVYGGKIDDKSLKIEPTILSNINKDDLIMTEEIFGPLLPIIEYDNIDEIFSFINDYDTPLALYIFSKNKKIINKIITDIGFGGGCINDTIIHLATSNMSFGGFKNSGIGSYHGKKGFETFSHYKSIVDKKTWIDLPMRYQPYSKFKDFVIRRFLK